ncbi:MAG: radical SAM protein [Candidatus Gastranaerophilales bacterium]|nr:radical SAM protein [Candidatus Gastranaerophilales bacterium]
MKIRIHKILKNTKVEGPKNRYCIWIQGCSRHCRGCWARATWDFNGGTEYDVNEILKDILNTKNIDGVTFLGGEPFEQPEALGFLCRKIKEANLSIVCFTGNRLEDIKEKHKKILENIDLLIDGEFKEEEKDFSRPWVGSKNQNYHFLSNKFNQSILEKYKNKVELNIQKDGTIFINGMGDFNELTKKLKLFSIH